MQPPCYYTPKIAVSNGPKEQLGAGEGASGSEEFEPWRSQQQNSAAHTAYPSVPISTGTDLYNMNTTGRGCLLSNLDFSQENFLS